MEHVEAWVKATMGEIEEMLDTKKVIGEPVTFEGVTVIPLVSLGFGFGAGGGSGSGVAPGKGDVANKGEGMGGGTGGGGGIRPVGVIIVDKAGVRVEGIKGGTASVFEKVGETIGRVVEKRAEKRGGEEGRS